MPSPFPGMNPYLEQDTVWQDFHHGAIYVVREHLAPQVRPEYVVKVEELVFIHEYPPPERQLAGRVDVSVATKAPASGPGSALLSAPASGRIPVTIDFEKHAFLEIRDRKNQQLVTVIEILSPSNKQFGPDREQYLAKRRRIVASAVHLVEIDLLRGGPRMPIENLADCDYLVMVSRYEDRPEVGLWPSSLRDRLPVVPIPLRARTAELDLQAMINQVYDDCAYEDYIYEGQPQPALRPDDAAWAQAIIPSG